MRLTISDSPSTFDLYEWHLFDGPDGAVEARGLAATLEQVIIEVQQARERIWCDLVSDTDEPRLTSDGTI